MSSCVTYNMFPCVAGVMEFPSSNGVMTVGALVTSSKQSLPNDPIGTTTVTFTGVVVGSRIHIRDQADTTTLYDQIAATSTVVVVLSVYAAGSPLNSWRIKIRKASSAPTYRPYETLLTATVGSSSIYVSQIPDE